MLELIYFIEYSNRCPCNATRDVTGITRPARIFAGYQNR